MPFKVNEEVNEKDGSKHFSVSGNIGDNWWYWRIGPFKTRQEAEEYIKGKEEDDASGV